MILLRTGSSVMLKPTTYIFMKKKYGSKASLKINLKNKAFAKMSKAMAYQNQTLRQAGPHYCAHLQVTGSGALGAPACMYLMTDRANYLFNCGEGTQRISHEYQCKLSKTDNIFITNLSWKNIGGLPGFLLTAQDNSLKKVKIHGPDGLSTFMEKVKSFTYYENLDISYGDTNGGAVYKDNVMTITYVPITKSTEHIRDCSTDSLNEVECGSNINGKRSIDPETTKENGNVAKKMKQLPQVVSYICKLHPRQGKLLISKCIDLGIPPGPLCSQLKNGLDVVKDDGTIVRSSDVCQPYSPATIFLVVECPTEEYLDSFVNHPAFLECQQITNPEENEVRCIAHFTPAEVFNTERYQNWIKGFPSETQHITFNTSNTCMGSEAVYKNQYILNMLHPEIFPLLNVPVKYTQEKLETQEDEQVKTSSVLPASTGQVLHFRPVVKPIATPMIHQNPKYYINSIMAIPHFQEAFENLKTNIEKKSAELDLSNTSDFPRVVMLGTGCSVPSKVRNTSGILLRIDAEHSILLDCGEGTLGQIIRFYGISESNNVLRSIKAIYVSHIHADHHLGLIGLLLRRKELTNDPLYLLAPSCMTPWLNFYNERFESIAQQYSLLDNNDFYQNCQRLSISAEKTLYSSVNIKDICTTYVSHCYKSYGVAVTLNDGKKIVYSGDTMFSKNLIELGKNCDLLIHEATMDDHRANLAKQKLHSTTSEAIKAGKLMQANFTLLTHFSQRYSKIPALPVNETNVGLSYDNMEFKLAQLPLLPLFYPCMKIMFHKYNKVETK